MTRPPRRHRLAAVLLSALATLATAAQNTDAAPAEPPAAASAPATPEAQSALDAQLFYEILLGELSATAGDPNQSYALMLDAARRSNDPRVYQRAADLALQARNGPAALTIVRAWKQAFPDSRDARRLELQILIALNRLDETAQPLRAELAATPISEHPALLAAIARIFSRATDKKQALAVARQALADDLQNPATAAPAWAALGRLRLNAGDRAGALEAAQKGQDADPASDAPAILALELIAPAQPQAEAIVQRYLATARPRPEIRAAYARVLADGGRYADAEAALLKMAEEQPELPQPWLMIGALRAQMRRDASAETALRRYIDLAGAPAKNPVEAEERQRGLDQAYLQLSQLAERRKDYAGAERWLARVDSPDDAMAAQLRRASLLQRQGRLDQALQLVRALPEKTPEDARQKLAAQVELLRNAGRYQDAYDLLAKASAAAPDDGDLLYDQAMAAEKVNRLDDMERLLRRLIQLQPDNQNAYNALGYSLADRNVRLDEARTLIRKAVSLAPDDPFIADSLGWVEYRLGNTAEATRILGDAFKRRPDPEIGAHLGEVLWQSGQQERARAVWKEAAQADGDNQTLQETLKRLHVSP